ncbi:MAG: TVP38/TMEM64 family protein [Bdellovibrionales bacterium]|nr:TVP38/TMEM64 family protein [Bdellovibrionales bacterium]
MKKKGLFFKILIVAILVMAIFLFYYFGGRDYLNFAYLKQNLAEIQTLYLIHPILVLGVFIGAFLFLTILAIPGSLILTILSGAIFGIFYGTLIVIVSGTIGAVLSFLISRYLMKDYVNKKFHKQFRAINKNLEKDGILYLFVLRFIPVSPFVVINLILGLTNLRV